MAAFGCRFQKIPLRTERRGHRCHEFFTDRIQRWIGNLREQLLEIVVKRRLLIGKDGKRRIRAHGPDGFFSVLCHRSHENPKVLMGVSENLLPQQNGCMIRFRHGMAGQIRQTNEVFVQPMAIRFFAGDLVLQFGVVDDAALCRIDQEHLAGLETTFELDVFRGNIEHTDFGRHDDKPVVGDVVTRWPQSIAIECRANHDAIGEHHRCGSVPRLHQARVIFVEGLLLIAHRFVPVPCFRDEHHHRVRQRSTRHDEHLEGIVEHGGVASTVDNHGLKVFDVLAEQLRLELRFARFHPIDIAAERVDFSVVRDVPERMCQRPARKCVGAETLVNDGKSRDDSRVDQIREINFHLLRREHPLVDKCPRREASEVHLRRRFFDALPDQVKLSFKVVNALEVRVAFDEDLCEDRLDGLGGISDRRVVRWYIAPAQKLLSGARDGSLDDFQAPALRVTVARKANHTDAVSTGTRQIETHFPALRLQELVRNLNQDSGSVTCIFFAAFGAAMLQVYEYLKRPPDDVVRFAASDVHNKADAACVVLKLRVVKGLFRRQCRKHIGKPLPDICPQRVADTLANFFK